MAGIDFEAEGLLDGLEGKARDARLRLLAELADDGVSAEELRRAVAEDRLALLPVERLLGGGDGRYTADEIAEQAGLPRQFLDRQRRALGLAVQPDDATAYTDVDLEAARRAAALRAGGLPDEGILETARLLGMTMSQLAAANRTLVADTFLGPEDDEYEIAHRLADAADAFVPITAASLAYTLKLHLRERSATTRSPPEARAPDRGPRRTPASASPTWWRSPSSARRCRPRSWGRSPAVSASSRPRWSSRRCASSS